MSYYQPVTHFWLATIKSTACTGMSTIDGTTEEPTEVTCQLCIIGMAGVVEAKLTKLLHYHRRDTLGTEVLCGAAGDITGFVEQVTCPDCQRRMYPGS